MHLLNVTLQSETSIHTAICGSSKDYIVIGSDP
eukprot:gene36642-biopygen15445